MWRNSCFAEINPDSWNVDATTIEHKITKNKGYHGGITFWVAVRNGSIMELAAKHNLIVIDDSAEVITGQYKNQFPFADMAVYSLKIRNMWLWF